MNRIQKFLIFILLISLGNCAQPYLRKTKPERNKSIVCGQVQIKAEGFIYDYMERVDSVDLYNLDNKKKIVMKYIRKDLLYSSLLNPGRYYLGKIKSDGVRFKNIPTDIEVLFEELLPFTINKPGIYFFGNYYVKRRKNRKVNPFQPYVLVKNKDKYNDMLTELKDKVKGTKWESYPIYKVNIAKKDESM